MGRSVIGDVCVYRVIQKEGSVFWNVIISYIVSKKVRMNGYRNKAV